MNAAREIQAWVLETLAKTQGPRHRNTITAAVNLLNTLRQDGDDEAASEVRTRLLWLVEADPGELDGFQRGVRDWLVRWGRGE